MRTLWIAVAAALPFAGFAQSPQSPKPSPPLGNEEGFFKPAADPALTALRPAPRQQTPPATNAGNDDEMTRQIRAAEEALLARAAREHEATHDAAAQARSRVPPPVGSPLDGTAPILSPLDGTAPILSPVGR